MEAIDPTVSNESALEGLESAAACFAELLYLLGMRGVLVDAVDCAIFTKGARYGDGTCRAVLRPESHQQVVEIVRICVQYKQALILQGANTGLVAASTPDHSHRFMILNLGRLNQHIEIDLVNRSVVVDAGVHLQELNEKLEEHGLFFPIDLSANPSIGGMIAANTGGAKLIKYGDVRQNLLGLRAVLIDPVASVLDLQNALRKNNTGLDLKQLFVGTSGAFGIITRAVLQVHYLPKQTVTALVVPHDQSAVLELLQVLERDCHGYLPAFEGISGSAFQAVLHHIPGIQNPFGASNCPDYCVLVELSGGALTSANVDLQDVLMNSLEGLYGEVVVNAVLGKGNELWRIRHSISEALRHEGQLIAFDIAMPRSSLVAFRTEALALVADKFPWMRVMDFGHWADGGCHFNLVWPRTNAPAYDADLVYTLRCAIYDLVVWRHHGSFSAEHGIGPYNIDFYQRYVSEQARLLSGQIQAQFDPGRLLGLTWFGYDLSHHR